MNIIQQPLPSVTIAPELNQYFDVFSVDTPKLGRRMTEVGLAPEQITDTHLDLAIAKTSREKGLYGTLDDNRIVMFPKNALDWTIEDAKLMGDPLDRDTLNGSVSSSLDATLNHELQHRQDDLNGLLFPEKDQFAADTGYICRQYMISKLAQFLAVDFLNADCMELFAGQLLPSTVRTAGIVTVGAAGVVWVGKQTNSIWKEIRRQRYFDQPSEQRARSAELHGPKGFFDISIRPEYLASL